MNSESLLLPKLKFARHWRPTYHRSGWGYAIDALDCLHCAQGTFLDGFIEKKFSWGCDPGEGGNGLAPYSEPWIGFVHHPPAIPHWLRPSLDDILETSCWDESLTCCQGLFTLSATLREWLRPRVPVRVCNLLHPTETPEKQFKTKKYLSNTQKQIIQVGGWLRRFRSIYELRVSRLKKVVLSLGEPWADAVHQKERDF